MADLLESRWLRRGIALVVALAVVGGGWAAYAAHGRARSGYRTAAAAKADVTQTLGLSGTVTPLGRSDLEFGTSGTVAWVASIGRRVKQGQVVGRLDLSDLRSAVAQAQARVDSAVARLGSDRQTRSDQLAAIAEEEKEEAAAKAAAAQAAAAQKARAAQQGQQGGAQQADPVAAAEQACTASASTGDGTGAGNGAGATTPAGGSASGTPGGGASATAAPSATPSAAARRSTAPGATTSTGITCAQALKAVEQYVDGLTKQLQQAGSSTGSTASLGSTSSTDSRSAGGSSATPAVLTVTTATLAGDQASIASARSALVSARVELRGGTLRAPAAGRVADTDVAAGDSASSGSTAVTILGKGVTTVSLSVSDTQVRELEVGQTASVLPPGAVKPLAGTVTRIGDVPDSSSSSTTTYPVTVTLSRTDLSLLAGTTASVTIDIGRATNVLTVPTSAVQDGTVEVLRDGTASTVRVTTGVVGPTRTQITDGLSAGDRVILADLSESVPTGSSEDTRLGGGFGGGLTGGFSGGLSGAGGGLPGGFSGRG